MHDHSENTKIDFNSVWFYIPILLLYVLYVLSCIGYAVGASDGYMPWTSLVVVSLASMVIVALLFKEHISRWWVYLWVLANKGEQDMMDMMKFVENADLMSDVELGSENNLRPSELRELRSIMNSSSSLDLVPSAIAFIFWLTYGILFADFPVGDVISQLFGVLWIIWLVMLHSELIRRMEPMRKSVTLALYLGMIFFPATAAIPTHIAWYGLLVKMTLFYILFFLISVDGKTAIALRRGSHKEFRYSVERKISQSAWVLFAPTAFSVFAVLQIGVLVWWIFKMTEVHGKKTDEVSSTTLTHSSASTPSKGKKKDKKKRRKKKKGNRMASVHPTMSDVNPAWVNHENYNPGVTVDGRLAIMPSHLPHHSQPYPVHPYPNQHTHSLYNSSYTQE